MRIDFLLPTGTPLACAAALAVLDVIDHEQLLAHVASASGPWIKSLQQLAREFPTHVLGVRGCGFMIGVQMAGDSVAYVAALRERGLLAPSAGGNVVRFLPSLTATDADLAKSVEIFRATLAAQRN